MPEVFRILRETPASDVIDRSYWFGVGFAYGLLDLRFCLYAVPVLLSGPRLAQGCDPNDLALT